MKTKSKLSQLEFKLLEYLYYNSSDKFRIPASTLHYFSGRKYHNTLIKILGHKLWVKLGFAPRTFPSREMFDVYGKDGFKTSSYQTYWLTSIQKRQVKSIILAGYYD